MMTANHLFDEFKALSVSQRSVFDRIIIDSGLMDPSSTIDSKSDFENLLQVVDNVKLLNGNEDRTCPCCHGNEHVKKAGKNKSARTGAEVQKYYCKECKTFFSPRTGSFLHNSHAGLHKWLMLMVCIAKKETLCQTAKACHIAQSTAFAWRHKLLDSIRKHQETV